MSSKAQKKHGYPLPENEWEETTQSFCIVIPNGLEWEMAMRAQLYLLGKWWYWKRDDDRPKASSDAATTWRTLLEINQECGDMATKEDIRDGIYEAANRIALQIATGQYANIGLSTDEDGTVTQGTEDTVDLPEDDPATIADETQAAIFGGTISVTKALELFYDKLDSYYGPTNGTPIFTAADTKTFIKSYFPNDGAAMDSAIDIYYTYRTTNSQLVHNTGQPQQLYMYCHGSNERAWQQWLIDLSSYSVAKIQTMTALSTGLSEEFWSYYLNLGLPKPSTVYLEAGCVPSPREIMLLNVFAANVTSQTSWKNNHRLKFTITGVLTDPAGHKRDFWYYDANNAAPVFVPASMSMQLGTGITKPTINQVPFSATGSYVFTIDTPASAGPLVLNMAAGGVFNAPFTGGPISITIDDLGEIAV